MTARSIVFQTCASRWTILVRLLVGLVDLTVLLGCIYLAIVGAGPWSVYGLRKV